MTKQYAKILRALRRGKTCEVFVCSNHYKKGVNRIRIVTPRNCDYYIIEGYMYDFDKSCFMYDRRFKHQTRKQIVESMEEFDEGYFNIVHVNILR